MPLVSCLADVYNQAQRIAPEREDQRLSLIISTLAICKVVESSRP